MNTQTKKHGFTLIEMLTVIGILAVLVVIAFPVGFAVRKSAKKAISQNTVNTLSLAVDMYKQDMDELPGTYDAPNSTYTNSSYNESLVLSLTGYRDAVDDFKDGFGFRVESRGKVYGPYNGTEKIKTSGTDPNVVFVDSFDNPIYYGIFDGTSSFDSDIAAATINDYMLKDTAKSIYYRRDFFVISAGPDGSFSSDLRAGDSDDITNFDY